MSAHIISTYSPVIDRFSDDVCKQTARWAHLYGINGRMENVFVFAETGVKLSHLSQQYTVFCYISTLFIYFD